VLVSFQTIEYEEIRARLRGSLLSHGERTTPGGSADGSEDGSVDGSADGSVDGSADGSVDGSAYGPAEGLADGSADSSADATRACNARVTLREGARTLSEGRVHSTLYTLNPST